MTQATLKKINNIFTKKGNIRPGYWTRATEDVIGDIARGYEARKLYGNFRAGGNLVEDNPKYIEILDVLQIPYVKGNDDPEGRVEENYVLPDFNADVASVKFIRSMASKIVVGKFGKFVAIDRNVAEDVFRNFIIKFYFSK